MTILVSLLYAAEVGLVGYWRWTAIGLAFLLLIRLLGDSRPVRLSNWIAASLLAVGAAQTQSPILAANAVLVVVPRQGAQSAAWLTLVALGIHVLWWRYLGAMPLDLIPQWVADLASFIAGSTFHVTSAGVATGGHFIRFSAVPLATVAIPMLVALSQVEQPRAAVPRFFGLLVLALLSTLATVAILTIAGHVHFFATGGWTLVPIAVGSLAAILLPSPASHEIPQTWGLWSAAVVVLAVLWSAGMNPTSRSLRIAFDEAHGKWETIDASFGTSKYGRDTVYNYALLARWLQTKHTVIPLRQGWRTIDADVLVIKMPTSFYSDSEKTAIDAFVRAGGLLLVLGDHTNLYGTALIINDLLGRYGFEIEATASVPLADDHYDYRPAWWQRTRYLRSVEYIQFQTSASIKTRHPYGIPFLVGDQVVAEEADYSNERFFGDLHPGPEDRQAPIVLGAERRLGRGRIILFADSTIFSSFSMMAPGNRELFQNFMEMGTAHRSALRMALLGLAFLLFLVRGRGCRCTLTLAVAPVVLAFATWSGAASASVEMYPAKWIDFDMLHSRMELRFDPLGTHGSGIEDYSTFFAWVGRTWAMPLASRRPYQDPKRPTILINPDKPFTRQELEEIEHYVKLGGHLLLLDDPRFSTRSTTNDVLHHFAISTRLLATPTSINDPGPPKLSAELLALPFDLVRDDHRGIGQRRADGSEVTLVPSGTTSLLVNGAGLAVASQRQVGAGALIFVQNSTMFSDFGLGDVWGGQELDPERERMYQLVYDLIALLRPKEPK